MVLLLVIAAFVALSMYNGYKEGMVKIILSFLALAITLVIVVCATPVITKAVKKTDQFQKVVNKTEEKLEEKGVFKEGSATDMINKLDVPQQIKDTLLESNTVEKYEELSVKNANEYIVNMLASIILTGTVFAILLLVVFVLVRVAISVLDLLSKLPLIKQMNKTGGLILGAAEGILLVWVFFVVVNIFGNTAFATMIYDQVNQNEIVTFIYNNNLVMKILLKLIA